MFVQHSESEAIIKVCGTSSAGAARPRVHRMIRGRYWPLGLVVVVSDVAWAVCQYREVGVLNWRKAHELPGCAADGATRQESLANAEVVIAEWIETARELGRDIPEPKGRLLFA